KIQNKCCQIIVFPPRVTSKNAVPNIRSNMSKNKLIVKAGNANKMSTLVIKVAHVNIGIRMYVIPGARMLTMVAKKLIPPINVPEPRSEEHTSELQTRFDL